MAGISCPVRATIDFSPPIAMLLSIKEMEVRKIAFAEAWQPGEIDFSDAGVLQAGPLKAEGVAELLPHSGEEVRVHGKVDTTLETECDRCLGRATFPVAAQFDLFYKPVEADATADEIAIDEGEAEMGFYELPGLVLEDILREQLLLQLPMQRICSEGCKGICPVCGANRNESVCGCDASRGQVVAGGLTQLDERWKALRDLKVQ
jgi:uncharacterized protein